MAGHQADGGRQVGRSGGHPEQARHHVEIQRSGIHLPDSVEGPDEAESLGQRGLQRFDLGSVTVE